MLGPTEFMSIAGIARETGFSDQAHLTHRFRAPAGTTPARYRESFVRPDKYKCEACK
jgi:transcriptional regulator GlxA family with amidase domain